jgi:cytochrome c-type biogenesis protein CcsB
LKAFLRSLCVYALLLSSAFAIELPSKLDYTKLASLPILEAGRYKPLEAYAGKTVETITGRWNFEKKNPVGYVLAFLVSPEWANEELILIDYRPLKEALGLDVDQKRFSYNTLAANAEFQRRSQSLMQRMQTVEEKDLTTLENRFASVLHRMNLFSSMITGQDLTIVPAPSGSADHAPWSSIIAPEGYGEEQVAATKAAWNAVLTAFRNNDPAAFDTAAVQLKAQMASLNPEMELSPAMMEKEVKFYHSRPFLKSWIYYLVAFFAFLLAFQFRNKVTISIGCIAFALGYFYNSYGFITRSIIAGHPSVSNMYESVIFVSFGLITIALVFELIYRQLWFVTAGSFFGVILIVMADLMPFDSNIDPLVPVLKSNYWLIVHVMTITLSYSAFALALGLAHIVLIMYFFRSKKEATIDTLSLFLYRVLQVGIVLLAAGTILGGVWAAESWGRFWGWDPKETWSLISLLGYLAILHARYTNWLKNIGTAVCAVLGFWLILMTWYGVNFILGTGLHSYGFGAGGGWYILAFLLFETLFLTSFAAKHYLLVPQPVPVEFQEAPGKQKKKKK